MNKKLNQNVEANNEKNTRLEYALKQKEELKEKLKDTKVIYVSYLNTACTKMQLWYVDKEDMSLQKIWVDPDLGKDKPVYWGKSGLEHSWSYCFKATGYGYSKSDAIVRSVYNWLGIKLNIHNMPRIENLN